MVSAPKKHEATAKGEVYGGVRSHGGPEEKMHLEIFLLEIWVEAPWEGAFLSGGLAGALEADSKWRQSVG